MVRKATDAVDPEIPSLGIGHAITIPESWSQEDPEIAIFPTKAELLQPGPDDGKRFRVGVCFCVTDISLLFDDEPHIDWIVPVRYDDVLEGPRISITGEYRKHPVTIHLYDRPPKDYGAVTVFEPSSGKCRVREV